MNKEIRYVAEPAHVGEFSLRGSASFAFWARHLKQEDGLALAAQGDKAQLALVAAEMSWMGIRFCEVSISLAVTHRKARDTYLLLQAFNSNRFFAWSERTLFKTPYAHGQCRIALDPQPEISVSVAGSQILQVQKDSGERSPLRTGNDSWEGPVFLPAAGAGKRRLFFGCFRGETTVYPFSGTDSFALAPHPGYPILQALLDSDFQPEQWVLRPDATHGKSKTYSEGIL